MRNDASPDDLPQPSAVARVATAAYPPGVPASYAYPRVPVTRLLDDAAADFPDTVAVRHGRGRLTFDGLLDAADRTATGLQLLGVQPGDRVGVALSDGPAHVALLFAVLRLGAVVSEHAPTLAPDLLSAQVADAGCRVLVLDAAAATDAAPPAAVEKVVVAGTADVLPVGRATAAVPPAVTQAQVVGTDPAVVVYPPTGETCGTVLSHANLIAGAFQLRLWVPDVLAGQERVLSAWPLHTSAGLTAALGLGVLSAATLIQARARRPRRAGSDTLWRELTRRRPTLLAVPPTVAAGLAQGSSGRAPPRRRHDATSVRVTLCGPGEVGAEVLERLESLTGGKISRVHGVAEAALTHANPVYGRSKRGTVGLPLPDTASVVVDPADPGRVLPPGVTGRLAVSGPQVFAGWWQRPQESADAFAGPWLLTADMATTDADGYVTVLDRPGEGQPRPPAAGAGPADS